MMLYHKHGTNLHNNFVKPPNFYRRYRLTSNACKTALLNKRSAGCSKVIFCKVFVKALAPLQPLAVNTALRTCPYHRIYRDILTHNHFIVKHSTSFLLKKKGWCDMISIVKKDFPISRDLISKIEWACRLNSINFEHQMKLEGCLRII